MIDAGQGRPLVFLHGWSMDGRVFADAAARLSPGFRCLAPDLPGHGGRGPHPATIDGAAAALQDLLCGHDLHGAVLVGWSMGATVAWRHIARFGAARIAAIASLDMSPRIENSADWRLGLRGQGPAGAGAKSEWFRTHWHEAAPLIAEGMFGTRGSSPLMSRAEATARIAPRDPATMAALWSSLAEADERATIARLPVPMLVIHGGQSRLYKRETALWLERAAPRALRCEFPAAGHAPHLEAPDRFAATLSDFLRSL